MKQLVFSLWLCLFIIAATGQTKYKSITWEKFRSSGPELKQVGWLETRHSKDIRSSPWSVGCETLDRDYGDFSKYENYVGELGVKHARLQSGWAKCEKERGVYNFAWLDSCVYGLIEQGVEPWISLSYGNPIYNSEMSLGGGLFVDEETITAWCKYVEATVSRYRNVVKEWEIWNEPRHSEDPMAYANLLIRTSDAVRKVQPNATIMGFTVHGFSPTVVLKFPKAVVEILKERKRLNVVDYVTYHPYTPNPDDCYPMVEDLQKIFAGYNPKVKFYMGESGCPSILEWSHAMNTYPWTEYSKAKWDLRRMAGDRARDIRTSMFTIVDLQYTSMLQSFGLLRANSTHDIIYKRPSFYGVQHMAGFFDYNVKPTGMIDYVTNSSRSLTVAGFEKQQSPVILFWYDDQIPGDELKWDPIALTMKDVNFKDPVYVEMITGKVFELPKQSWRNEAENVRFERLPAWDSPVMLVERSQLKMKAEL